MNALSQIAGVEEAVKAISLEMAGTIFHQSNGKTRVRLRKKPLVTLNRTNLVIALLETLTQVYDSRRLNIHFDHKFTQVNLETKKVDFQNTVEASSTGEVCIDYDLLIGADGSHSAVRAAFLDTELFEFEQKYTPTDYKSIFLPRPDHKSGVDLESGKIHSWRIADGTFVMLLHQRDGTMSGVILFPRKQNQVTGLSTPEAVLQFFRNHFPEVGELIPESEVKAFLKRPPSRILTVRCSRYHHGDSVLLIGDAAHSVSPSIGQGCNAALEDVVIFNNLLDEYSDNLAEAIAQFTTCRKVDAHALVELGDNAFPSAPGLFIEFILREQIYKILHQLFPQRFPPSLSDLVFETTVPYSKIMNMHKGWIAKVKNSNEKFLAPM